jgi:hypothetical protein
MCVLGLIAGLVWSLIGLASPATTVSYPVGDGCVAVSGASCSYAAREVGSIEAVGTHWRVDIVRGTRTLQFGPDVSGEPSDGVFVDTDVIRPGDRVRAVTGATSPPFFGFVSVGANERTATDPTR